MAGIYEEDITNRPSPLGVLDQLMMLAGGQQGGQMQPQPQQQQPQPQPAFLPQSPGQQAANVIDDKTMNQIAQMMLKEATNNKPIGPDVIEKMTGQPGQGGFFGVGIQPTDVMAALFGAFLTRGMPQHQAIQTTLQMATLPAKFRQQHRENLQQLLGTIANISHQQQQTQISAGTLANSQQRTAIEQAKLNEPTLARIKAALAANPNTSEKDLRVLLGLTAPSQDAETIAAHETARRTAAEPFQIRAEQRQLTDRKAIIQLAAGLRRQDPTAMSKNVEMVEKRLGKKLSDEELKKLLFHDQGEDRIVALMRMLGGGGGGGGGLNLSPEAQDLLKK